MPHIDFWQVIIAQKCDILVFHHGGFTIVIVTDKFTGRKTGKFHLCVVVQFFDTFVNNINFLWGGPKCQSWVIIFFFLSWYRNLL